MSRYKNIINPGILLVPPGLTEGHYILRERVLAKPVDSTGTNSSHIIRGGPNSLICYIKPLKNFNDISWFIATAFAFRDWIKKRNKAFSF